MPFTYRASRCANARSEHVSGHLPRRATLATLLAGAAMAFLWSSDGASAATTCDRVASPSGSDGGAGTLQSPYRSAQKLVDSLAAGQTGCLRAGTYTQLVLSFHHGGSSGAPVTLTS